MLFLTTPGKNKAIIVQRQVPCLSAFLRRKKEKKIKDKK